ncbi:hypothetical protein B0H16DRAFT_253019 [Mycena metata]|uniref:Uncharacterized protein n=1 Tax=Mycena metata TaxID=1033252 RepID=A0AAD7HUA7_9AGAR|nr:hypothetical protein B0H16DRAFT_253019 [Mycena metata]
MGLPSSWFFGLKWLLSLIRRGLIGAVCNWWLFDNVLRKMLSPSCRSPKQRCRSNRSRQQHIVEAVYACTTAWLQPRASGSAAVTTRLSGRPGVFAISAHLRDADTSPSLLLALDWRQNESDWVNMFLLDQHKVNMAISTDTSSSLPGVRDGIGCRALQPPLSRRSPSLRHCRSPSWVARVKQTDRTDAHVHL